LHVVVGEAGAALAQLHGDRLKLAPAVHDDAEPERHGPRAAEAARRDERHVTRALAQQLLRPPTNPAFVRNQAAASSGRKPDIECRMLVLGAGPGGYTAAFRAADLGLDTVLVERYPHHRRDN
jgi:dihydrolipoamide dehydrogenase